MGGRMRVVRVLGVLEPGGGQLSALLLSAALRRRGGATTLLAGDATPPGLALAARYGFAAEAFEVSELVSSRSLQWTPEPRFADWLRPRRGDRVREAGDDVAGAVAIWVQAGVVDAYRPACAALCGESRGGGLAQLRPAQGP